MSRLLRFVFTCIVGSTVLLTAAQHLGSSRAWWLELSRFLPFPALLLPALWALLLACWLGRGWRVAGAANLALVATLTMGLEWRTGDTATATATGTATATDTGTDTSGALPVRVMTYNVKSYRASQRAGGFDALAREVALHHPDILVMQDAGELPAATFARRFPLGTALGYPHLHAAGQYFVASRFALRDCVESGLGRAADGAHYLRCTVEAGGIAVTLVTVHFASPRHGLNAARHEGFDGVDDWQRNLADRLAQAAKLAGDLAAAPTPLIVAGDLNASQSSPVIDTLQSVGLRDAFVRAGRGYGYTYGQALRPGFSFLRIDHILVSAGIGVTRCYAGGAEASEHRPVIADLLLRRAVGLPHRPVSAAVATPTARVGA